MARSEKDVKLALDVPEMRRLELDLESRRCAVEPGMIQGELNTLVEPHGLVFGADTCAFLVSQVTLA